MLVLKSEIRAFSIAKVKTRKSPVFLPFELHLKIRTQGTINVKIKC